MKKADRLELAKTFLASMTETILKDIEKMPDEFDGFEIRVYCAEAFEREAPRGIHWPAWTRKRALDFNNWRAISPVRY